ncbi:MAG: hypothetical protein ABIS08_10005 [Pseudolysinimonas sp.]
MRSSRWARPAAIAAIAAVALAGCSSGPRGVILSPSETAIEKCTDASPRAVADLKMIDCDLQGVTIVFPDGQTLMAPEIGGGGSTQTDGPNGIGDNHQVTNLGIYGVVAAESDPDGTHTRWWGSRKGIAKMQASEGPELAPNLRT